MIELLSDFSGKVAIVTGSTNGIGYEIANSLKSRGCSVVLNGRQSGALQKAMAQLGVNEGIVADVSTPAGAKEVIAYTMKRFGKLHFVVCNVGDGKSVPPGEETYEEWVRMLGANLLSCTNIVQNAVTALENSRGAIVCISSICGLEVVPGAPVTYSVAKAALNAFVKCSSKPLGKKGIRINAIAPGNIIFPGSVWEKKVNESPEVVKELIKNEVSLHKLGEPHDISSMVSYLLSSHSRFITGSVFQVDGGQVRGI